MEWLPWQCIHLLLWLIHWGKPVWIRRNWNKVTEFFLYSGVCTIIGRIICLLRTPNSAPCCHYLDFSVVPSILGFLLTESANISTSVLFWFLKVPRFHCYQQPQKFVVFTTMEACHSQIVPCPFYINFNLVSWCQALVAPYDHFILLKPIVVYYWDYDKYISLKDQRQNKHH